MYVQCRRGRRRTLKLAYNISMGNQIQSENSVPRQELKEGGNGPIRGCAEWIYRKRGTRAPKNSLPLLIIAESGGVVP